MNDKLYLVVYTAILGGKGEIYFGRIKEAWDFVHDVRKRGGYANDPKRIKGEVTVGDVTTRGG